MTTTVTDRATFGYALAHDEGETFWFAGMLQTVKIGSADTGGRYGLIEFLVPPGLGSPWHVHTDEDEWFYVLDGNLTVYVGDTRVDLAPGGGAFGPTGVPHTFIGAGPDSTRVLVGLSPVQFEGFLREVGHPRPAGTAAWTLGGRVAPITRRLAPRRRPTSRRLLRRTDNDADESGDSALPEPHR